MLYVQVVSGCVLLCGQLEEMDLVAWFRAVMISTQPMVVEVMDVRCVCEAVCVCVCAWGCVSVRVCGSGCVRGSEVCVSSLFMCSNVHS